MTDPTLLRRAIESVGIEKPSDYTLVLEEVERLMDEAGTMRRLQAWANDPRIDLTMRVSADYCRQFQTDFRLAYAVVLAATDLVQEMEEMGYGKTSDRALPGSWDTMVAALEAVRK